MLVFNLAATPLFNLIGPTATEFWFGLLLLALGATGFTLFRRYERRQRRGAAEHGKYHTSRTPYAREVMRCLSPAHPCRRVVVMGASQMLKTQVALNWMGALIHMAPGNIMALEDKDSLKSG